MSNWANDFILVMDAVAYFFSFLMLAVLGVALLIYTVASTMAKLSKQRDDVEQLALKFSHRR